MRSLIFLFLFALSNSGFTASSQPKNTPPTPSLKVDHYIQCQIQDLTSTEKGKAELPKMETASTRLLETDKSQTIYTKGSIQIRAYAPLMNTKLEKDGPYLSMTKNIAFEVFDNNKKVFEVVNPSGISTQFKYEAKNLSIQCF